MKIALEVFAHRKVRLVTDWFGTPSSALSPEPGKGPQQHCVWCPETRYTNTIEVSNSARFERGEPDETPHGPSSHTALPQSLFISDRKGREVSPCPHSPFQSTNPEAK